MKIIGFHGNPQCATPGTSMFIKLGISLLLVARPTSSLLSSRSFPIHRKFARMSSIEEAAALTAASTDPAVNPFAPTFFDKIVSKEIPANIIFEDDLW